MANQSSLSVRVTPRSSRDEIIGWRGDVLLVRLKAPPVEGQANDALCRFLARHLRVPPAGIEIVSGASSRSKRLRIHGLSDAELLERIAVPS